MKQQFSSLCYEREESFVVKQYLKESSPVFHNYIPRYNLRHCGCCFSMFWYFFCDIEVKEKKHSVKAISKSFI